MSLVTHDNKPLPDSIYILREAIIIKQF